MAVVDVEGDGDGIGFGENGADVAGEGAGAGLDEDAAPVAVHTAHGLPEADGPGDVAGHEGSQLVHLGGHR